MAYSLARVCVSVAALALVAACGNGGSGGNSGGGSAITVDASKITPGCFQGGTSPELQIGSGFPGADWNDPHVLKVGAQYWMYASSNMGFAPTPPSPVQIYRFTSSDAASWTLPRSRPC